MGVVLDQGHAGIIMRNERIEFERCNSTEFMLCLYPANNGNRIGVVQLIG